MSVHIHPSWHEVLAPEFEKPYWESLTTFVKGEYSTTRCFPEGKHIFRAFDLTPFDRVKVVILGQDPYHTAYIPVIPGLSRNPAEKNDSSKATGFLPAQEGQEGSTQEWQIRNPPAPLLEGGLAHEAPICAAMGLSFSVPSGSKPQPSLRNIFKELESDLGIKRTDTDLTDWAGQGVLLLNAVLTVREGSPASHGGKGWENFTDSVIHALSEKRDGLVFILWGNFAISKKLLIDSEKHHIITSPHPSPFSAHNGFFGSKPFSRANAYLERDGGEPIQW